MASLLNEFEVYNFVLVVPKPNAFDLTQPRSDRNHETEHGDRGEQGDLCPKSDSIGPIWTVLPITEAVESRASRARGAIADPR
jgi:hypothetical protein